MAQRTLPRRTRRPARRPRTPGAWIGPLGSWELVRLARRGQSHRGRLLTVYLLLIAFILTPVFWFTSYDPIELFVGRVRPLEIAEAADFGQRFTLMLTEAVLLAVAALAPGYAAAAVAEEKERRTLSLLLASPLSDREIVLGKAAGRLGFVLASALAGLPVVTLTALFGGTSLPFLVAGWLLIASTAVLATAIGIHAGCVSPDLRAGLVRAYGMTALAVGTGVIPPFVFLSPFGALVWLQAIPGWFVVPGALGYAAVQSATAAGFFGAAIRSLRRSDDTPQPPRATLVSAWPEPPVSGRRVDPPDPPAGVPDRVPRPRPPVDEADPLLWKERHVAGRLAQAGSEDRARVAGLLLGGLALVLMVFGAGILVSRFWEGRTGEDMGGHLLLNGATVALGLYLVPAAAGLSAAVARERHRQTLDALLALPIGRREILRAKVRAAMERGWGWGPAAALAIGAAFGADGGWPLGPAAGAFVLAGIALVAGLGAWLTARCPTEVRALRFLVPGVVVVVGVPVGLWNQVDWSAPAPAGYALAGGAVLCAAAGALFWWQAGRELGRAG